MSLNVKEAMRKWGPEYLAICGLAKYFPIMNSESHVFFVDGTDGNDGVNTGGQLPDEPFLTFTKALSKVTSGRNDFIFVLKYYQAAGETWPISISKGLVHIIGIGHSSGPSQWVQPTGQTAAFALTSGAEGVEIAGFELGAGSSHACIEMAIAGLWNTHIHHCGLGTENGMTAAYGIRTGNGTIGGELINALIEHNRFGDKLTASGIEVPAALTGPNDVTGTVIRKNTFMVDNSAVGINVPKTNADFQDGGIFDNKFGVVHNTKGAAITFGEGTKGMIDGNHIMAKDVSTVITVGTTRSIWIGTSGNGTASWGLNYLSGNPCTAETDYEE